MAIFFDGRNNDVENKKGNLYNDTVKKGDVALLGSAFGLGKVTGSNPFIPTNYLSYGQSRGCLQLRSIGA